MSHGPRGDIVSVYTTFPWPALCAEISKLEIELRSERVADGAAKALLQRLLQSTQKAEIAGEKK
jgi:hypothetical protein